MKLSETSLLEYPLRLLTLFPIVKKRYAGNYRNVSGYEHVWTGVVFTLIVAVLMQFSNRLIFLILIPMLTHIIWKEVILDASKRVNEYEMDSYKINLIERVSGFIFASPFLVVHLI